MSMKRIIMTLKITSSSSAEKEKLKGFTQTDSWQVAQRAQLNITEYTGFFLPLLLFIQYYTQSNTKGIKLSTLGYYSCIAGMAGSYLFAFGFVILSSLKNTNIFRAIGATTRYFAMVGLMYQCYLFL